MKTTEKRMSYFGNPELLGKTSDELLDEGYILVKEDGWSHYLSPDEYKIVKI